MPPRHAAAALVVLAAAAPAAADQAVFDFYIAGIRAGELTVDSEREGANYAAAGSVTATGIVGVLTDYAFDGTAEGRIAADGTVVPERFTAQSRSPRADRVTRIDWEDGTPVAVSVEPPRGSAPDPASQAGTLDPVSAGFAILGDQPPDAVCNTSIDIFDGSRRSRIVLGPPEAGERGPVCAGTYARIEGEAQSMTDLREFPFRLLFRETGGAARLDRIEARTGFGPAVLERRG